MIVTYHEEFPKSHFVAQNKFNTHSNAFAMSNLSSDTDLDNIDNPELH